MARRVFSDTDRRAALVLMRSGRATVTEAAKLVGGDRQMTYAWAKGAGINCAAARLRHLMVEWSRAKQEARG